MFHQANDVEHQSYSWYLIHVDARYEGCRFARNVVEGFGDSGREVLIGLTHRLAGDHDAAFRAIRAEFPIDRLTSPTGERR